MSCNVINYVELLFKVENEVESENEKMKAIKALEETAEQHGFVGWYVYHLFYNFFLIFPFHLCE